LRFKNNVIAEAHLDYFQRPNSRNCKIIGTKGTITCDIDSNTVKFYNIKNKKWITKLNLPKYDLNKTYIEELTHFIDCIGGKDKPINPLKEGIYTLKVALNAKKSSKLKKTLSISR
jgi:predicted dehydrogenase